MGKGKELWRKQVAERTGETAIMNCGLRATIIEYKNYEDMTVRFINGAIVKKTRYELFRKGIIKCPMIYNIKGDYVECINPNTNTVFLIDKDDLDKLEGSLWYMQGDYIASRRMGLLHRLIMNCPKGMTIDHINHDKLDNRKSNLRICTQSENSQNIGKKKTNTSGYKGVSLDKNTGKWRASIMKNRKSYVIGNYNTPEEAHAAYCKTAKELHGEFAKTA